MGNYGLVVDHKELRKAAFAVGFGLCMGKAVAKSIDTIAWTMFGKSLVRTAKKLATEASEIKNSTQSMVHDEPESYDKDNEIKMGFHK